MKKLTLLALVLSASLLSLHGADAPKKEPKANTLSTHRVFAKPGHEKQLRDGIAAHAAKYHTGERKWRVYEVLTGTDSGALQINEGPTSWTSQEERGDLGAEHMKDYETNITPHVEKNGPESYLVYRDEVSTVPAAKWSTKAAVTHYYYKPGRGPAFEDSIKTLKSTWEKLGANIVVWQSSASGAPQYVLVRRFKNGWKDYDEDGPSIKDTYEGINGAGSYAKLLTALTDNVERIEGEYIEFQADLSSK